MKKIPLVLLFCAALQFNTYAQKTSSEIDDESKAILSQIRAIRLVEVNQARTLVVKSLSYNPGKRGLARLNYPLEQLAVYKKGSEIVITDTVGLFNGNIHVEIVPSEEGVDIIIALDVLPNSYYCQMTVGDRGAHLIGHRLQQRSLQPRPALRRGRLAHDEAVGLTVMPRHDHQVFTWVH